MSKEFKLGKFWVSVGCSKRLAIGVVLDTYSFSLDFLCFWFCVEFPTKLF